MCAVARVIARQQLAPSIGRERRLAEQVRRRHHEMERIAQIVRDDAQHLLAGLCRELGLAALLALGVVAPRALERGRGGLREQQRERAIGGADRARLGEAHA